MSLPNAITREDFYLNKIANPSDDHELPDAITRQQHYLKAIAENAGGGGGQPFVYSEIERVVGEWINGKPIYQRTFHSLVNDSEHANKVQLFSVVDLGIETVVSLEGVFGNLVALPRIMLKNAATMDFDEGAKLNTYSRTLFISDNYVTIEGAELGTTSYADITLRYTKSADT